MNAKKSYDYYELTKKDKTLSFKEMKMKIMKVIAKYKKSIIQISFFNSLKKLNEKQENEKNECQAFVNYIDNILKTVSLQTKQYIENEFINQIDEEWCLKEHSRSYYYRIRNIAISEFFIYVQ